LRTVSFSICNSSGKLKSIDLLHTFPSPFPLLQAERVRERKDKAFCLNLLFLFKLV
jgi:hypothetical protein